MSDIAGLTLKQRVEDRIMLMGRKAGDEGLAKSLPVVAEGSAVYVTLREDIETGGSLSLMIKANDFDKGAVRLDEISRRTLRARARLRAIGGIEDADHHAEPWAFTIHSVIASVLRGVGADPQWIVPMHRNTGGQRMFDLALENTSVRVSDIKTEAGRITTDVLQIQDSPRMLLWENRDGCGVRVFTALPDTILMAIAGMTLGQVVDHPLLAGAAHVRIREARTDGLGEPATILILEDDPVPVRPAPEGVDMRWATMPF